MQFGFLFALFFAVIVTFFAIGNAQSILVNFFFAEFNIPTAALILICLAAGALITFFLGSMKYLKGIKQSAKLKKELKVSTAEIEKLNAQINTLHLSVAEKEQAIKQCEMEKEVLERTITKSAQMGVVENAEMPKEAVFVETPPEVIEIPSEEIHSEEIPSERVEEKAHI